MNQLMIRCLHETNRRKICGCIQYSDLVNEQISITKCREHNNLTMSTDFTIIANGKKKQQQHSLRW